MVCWATRSRAAASRSVLLDPAIGQIGSMSRRSRSLADFSHLRPSLECGSAYTTLEHGLLYEPGCSQHPLQVNLRSARTRAVRAAVLRLQLRRATSEAREVHVLSLPADEQVPGTSCDGHREVAPATLYDALLAPDQFAGGFGLAMDAAAARCSDRRMRRGFPRLDDLLCNARLVQSGLVPGILPLASPPGPAEGLTYAPSPSRAWSTATHAPMPSCRLSWPEGRLAHSRAVNVGKVSSTS